MYTENELQISNKSYTNKDFQSIYPELLDLVKKLTNKWDPTTSNESDPGVVLLKLGALLADKNNYNIDKNILEAFPLTVTQEANARRLYDMLGYSMDWYKSATTDISITYRGDLFEKVDGIKITIPKYTMFTNAQSSIVYTLVEECIIDQALAPKSVLAIQGTIHDYEVNGVSNITLDNLDSELRLFFTQTNVAQNGIFINNIGGDDSEWSRVDNLQSYELASKIYKFGVMPNTNTCYIQFPQDIGNLIGNGIRIKYILTDGEHGNVQARQIDTPKDTIKIVWGENTYNITNDLTIKNLQSSFNGVNPQSIDEAYQGYKKTIGTFDTLVTLRDYENASYKAKDQFDRPYVSNIVATDRTCDINYTTKVRELTQDGDQANIYIDKSIKNVNVTLTNGNSGTYTTYTPKMTAFDIGLYALSPVLQMEDDVDYNKSFSALPNAIELHSQLDKHKTSSHDYLPYDMNGNNYHIFKNFYTLLGRVHTNYKVTKTQAEEIEKNIKVALYKKFNARNVAFGQPINYDDIISTIEGADTRIKMVVLTEPQYELRYNTINDIVGDYDHSYSIRDYEKNNAIKLLAKMVLSGNVQLYKFDEDIDYKFGQGWIQCFQDIVKIEATHKVTQKDLYNNGNGYVIKPSQNIQLVSPNLYVDKQYSAFVNYNLSWQNASVPQNTYYQIPSDKCIYINYTDANNVEMFETIAGGTIIKFNDSSNSGASLENSTGTTIEKNDGNGDREYSTLKQTQSIDVLKVNASILNKGHTLPCMWFTNNAQTSQDASTQNTTTKYVLFDVEQTEKLLQDNEYFIYTNENKNELVILGAGTLLKRESGTSKVEMEVKTKVSDILSNGSAAIQDDAYWYSYQPHTQEDDNKQLFAIETQIVTLGEGAVVKLPEPLEGAEVVGKNGVKISGTIEYKNNKDEENWIKLSEYKIGTSPIDGIDLGWKIYSKMNVQMAPNFPQKIEKGQVVYLTDKNNVEYEIDHKNSWGTMTETGGGAYLLSNSILAFSGGGDSNLYSSNKGQPINIYKYLYQPINDSFEYNTQGDLIIRYIKDEDKKIDGIDNKNTINGVGTTQYYVGNYGLRFDTIATKDTIRLRRIKFPIVLHGNNTEAQVGVLLRSSGGEPKVRIKVDSQSKPYLYDLGKGQSIVSMDEILIDEEDATSSMNRFAGIYIYSWKRKSGVDEDTSINDYISIGKPRVIYGKDTKSIYSDQIITTLSNIYGDGQLTDKCDDLLNYTKNDGFHIVSYNNTFDFNDTHIVDDTNAIDTSILFGDEKDDLFSGNAAWDANHICNKYTIPQLNTKNIDIKVASSSLNGKE